MSRWIEMRDGQLVKRFKCPLCGYEVPNWTSVYYNFCHCCGADMEVNDEPWWNSTNSQKEETN